MGNYLTAIGKQDVAEAIMKAIGGRRDHGAASVARALAKKLSSSELERLLHVARNPATPPPDGWALSIRSIRDAALRVRDVLGAPSDAADIAYAVSCGDGDVAEQAAKRLQQQRLD